MRSLFQYRDYREYLNDYYLANKRAKPYFTHRYFAEKAGLASPMHLKLVMSGKRGLSPKTLPKFIQGLGLKEQEAEYFENLVFFCQAKSSTDKSYYLKKLTRITSTGKARRLNNVQQCGLFSEWFYPLIFELAGTKDFQEDGTWLANRLGRRISAAQASKALRDLIEAGLLDREESGQVVRAHYRVKTDDEVENLLIREFHKKMMDVGKSAIDDPLDEREFGFVTVATSRAGLEKLKPLVKEFIRTANSVLTEDGESAKDVYQLNVQLFRVTNRLTDR